MTERLRQIVSGKGLRLVLPQAEAGSNLVEGPSDPALLDADVAFGQPRYDDALKASKLKFIQITSAGYARYDRPEFREAVRARGGSFCNASGVYAEPCAEHAAAFMLSAARQLPAAMTSQLKDKGWPVRELRQNSRLLLGQSVLILGYGAIAARLVELLAPYRMKIKAVRRHVRGDEKVKTYPIIAADELIPDADHIVNLLPGTAETERFIDARRISLMKESAVFYNLGRGTTVDQYALWTALETAQLAAAYLDVTSPEPLDAESPLWTTPRCFITPHIAGGYEGEFDGLVDHFVANLDRYLRGEKLLDHVF